MNDHNSDKKLERLVQRSLVPRGLRPQTDHEIERLLDTVGGEPYSKEKLERMLRKVKGQDPVFGPSPVHQSSGFLSEAESELVEMFRAQGKPLPPELEAKLKEMERRAAENPEDDDPSDDE